MIKHYIHKSLTLPPHVTVKKAVARIKRAASEILMCRKDQKTSSYAAEYPKGTILSYFTKLSVDHLLPQAETIAGVTKHYLDHRFDLLGSGWVQIKHGMKCRGLEGYRYDMGKPIEADAEEKWLKGRINEANLSRSQQIWQLINDIKFKIPQRNDLRIPPQCDGIHLQGRRGRQNSKIKIDYLPIDWHLDFKSGYRWSESTWYKDIRYGHKLGVDVKVPWELARMQHLPQLAFAYAFAAQSSKPKAQSKGDKQETEFENQKSGKGQLESPERYALEFRSQVLDFIATNPPRFGVNWACTMDVAIRAANSLVAYDIFRAYGAEFDAEFERVFSRSIYEHGLHIINNLEWSEEHRSNHYLSDIAGLLFVAAYLPKTPETDAWIAFAVQELITEVKHQFYPDGGNFEASTSYHRLSAEMVTYATALVLGLPDKKANALINYNHALIKVKPGSTPSPLPQYKLSVKNNPKCKIDNQKSESPFPLWYFDRLEKMAEFTMHITKPNGHIPQIGDNDSGRFIKFQPAYKKMTVAEAKKKYLNLEGYNKLPDDALYWDEDFLDHRHLVAAINGLFDRDDFTAFAGDGKLESDLIRNLAGGICLSSYNDDNKPTAAEKIRVGSDNRWNKLCGKFGTMPEKQKQAIEIPLSDGAADGLRLFAYPDFGLYIFRSKRLYLSIRCGSIGQNGNSGHAHNDQLSIELNVDGKDIIVDPGTYLYTPLPERCNEYRSVKAHFAPQIEERKPGNLNAGRFKLGNATGGECLYFGARGFIGRHKTYGDEIIFIIATLERNVKLRILTVNQKNQSCSFPHRYSFSFNDGVYVFDLLDPRIQYWSPSYGKETVFYSRV